MREQHEQFYLLPSGIPGETCSSGMPQPCALTLRNASDWLAPIESARAGDNQNIIARLLPLGIDPVGRVARVTAWLKAATSLASIFTYIANFGRPALNSTAFVCNYVHALTSVDDIVANHADYSFVFNGRQATDFNIVHRSSYDLLLWSDYSGSFDEYAEFFLRVPYLDNSSSYFYLPNLAGGSSAVLTLELLYQGQRHSFIRMSISRVNPADEFSELRVVLSDIEGTAFGGINDDSISQTIFSYA